MEKKEYLVGVTIIEGRSLKGKDAAGTSDPFVKITCANMPTQVTQKKYQTNAVVWNQSFTFPGVAMNQYELETFEIFLEVYDYNAVKTNVLIGQASIALSTLYRNLNHEFHRVWLALNNPDIPNNEVQGYIQVSFFIVGPNERPPAHAADENKLEDDEMQTDETALAGLSEEQKLNIMKKKQGLFLLQEPGMVRKGYQLSVNILKAEGLPQCDSSAVINSFISVRASGLVQATRVIEENFNPVYNSRLCFPVFVPIFNDKITIRLWSKNRRVQDTFIANIPECPSPFDAFNITKLLACDGKLRATWFNLYGVHPMERGWFQNNNGNKKEGSSYLGRVLISMQLVPNDKPQLYPAVANPSKEPNSSNYQLWVDTYDLINCEEAEGKQVWVVATIGSYSSSKHYAKYRQQSQSYTWQRMSMKTLQVNLPTDPQQTPDIIISVYSETTFKGENRLGYIRLKARDYMRTNAYPQWHRLRSPQNEKTCPGIILMNVQYVWESATERFPKQRGVEGPFKLFAQILSGFEIAPSMAADYLNTKVDIKIGNSGMLKEGIVTKLVPGRYPQWNEVLVRDITMDKSLQFASDMRVVIYNCEKTLILRRQKWEVIGEFTVPIKSIAGKLYQKPQFFNVLNNEGHLQGQILARFYLKELDKRNKNEDHGSIIRELNSISLHCLTVNIELSVIGIRNLIYNAKQPVITIKLTHSSQEVKTIRIDRQQLNTKNPNFGKIIKFEGIKLPFEPLLWPQIELTLQDEGTVLGLTGCENCFTTLTFFEYAKDILTEKEINFAKAQFNKNQNRLNLVQPQLNPVTFYNKYVKNKSQLAKTDGEPQSSVSSDDDGNDSDLENNKDFEINMIGGMRIREYNQDLEVYQLDDDSLSDEDEDYLPSKQVNDALDVDDIQLNVHQKMKNKMKRRFLNDTTDELPHLQKAAQQANVLGNYFDGARVDKDNIIELVCTAQMKQDENQQRKVKIEKLERKIDNVAYQIQETQSKEKRETLKQMLISLKERVQELQDEEVNEHKFWGYVMEDEGQGEFQYGREVLKDGTYEGQLKLPYQEFPMFSITSQSNNKVAQVGGMLRSGLLTGAALKAAIVVKEVRNNEDDEESIIEQPITKKNDELFLTPGGGQMENHQSDQNKDLQIYNMIQENYPYDIMKERFLKLIVNVQHYFKVRVYLLTCQNLSATESSIDLKSRLAGMQALCSADPYPILIVGDGKNDKMSHQVKYISDRDKSINQDLNPKFYRTYELDATFPEDWKFELQIYDRGSFSYTDAIIGSTVIDLEDRLYGNSRKQTLDALHIYKEQATYELKRESKRDNPNPKIVNEQRKIIDDITKHQQKILNSLEDRPIPVEYRELRHPNKKQAQGMAEMWVEVLTTEEARKTPMTRLQVRSKDEYEIRLIVWETRDVPLMNGEHVDIFVKVQFDPTGWSGNQVEKTTDVHYGSQDGRGVFNYRFKFDVSYPCEFPRLKFQLYDFGYLSNESIGESNLNLQKTMNLLAKEGRIDIPKTWLSFTSPNGKIDECGQLLISMQILAKNEAELKPVGEGWDEPNEYPKLEKPTEGRGVGDRILAATNIDMGKIQLPKLNIYRNFIIFGVVIVVVIIVLVVVMILK